MTVTWTYKNADEKAHTFQEEAKTDEKRILCKFTLTTENYFNYRELTIAYHVQRWSRGHKARGQGQGQGHKKNPRPRPRTAFPRTDPLEAKDRNARGQGQGPRTQPQVFSKKKRSSKKFFRQFPIYRRSQNF